MADLIYIYLAFAAAVAVFIAVFAQRKFIVKRRVVCPEQDRVARVELACRSDKRGKIKPLRVLSCSVFEKPRHVTCDQRCVELDKWQRIRPRELSAGA